MYVNAKMIPVETIPEMRGGKDKGEWWRDEFKYDIFQNIVRTSVNSTIYSYPAQH
jgi:hypothetical protein